MIVSENIIQAVNATSVDALMVLRNGHFLAPSTTIKPARVNEAVFDMETKLLELVGSDTSEPRADSHGSLALLEFIASGCATMLLMGREVMLISRS